MYPLAGEGIDELVESDELVEFADGTEPTPRIDLDDLGDPADIIRQFDDIPTVNLEAPSISIARLKLVLHSAPPPPLPRRARAASPTVELEMPAAPRRPSTIEIEQSYEADLRKLR